MAVQNGGRPSYTRDPPRPLKPSGAAVDAPDGGEPYRMQTVYNFRDLGCIARARAGGGPRAAVRAGRLYRGGPPFDASEADASFLVDRARLRTVIGLRATVYPLTVYPSGSLPSDSLPSGGLPSDSLPGSVVGDRPALAARAPAGLDRARSHCLVAPPPVHSIPD